MSCSFEPDPIVEKEERERVNLLAQRDFLIRSYGMLEQVSYNQYNRLLMQTVDTPSRLDSVSKVIFFKYMFLNTFLV